MTFPQPLRSIPARKPQSRRLQRAGYLTALAANTLLLNAALMHHPANAAGTDANDPQAQYQRDKAACNNGHSQEDRATCLREAGAAYQQAKQGDLGNPAGTAYQQNALQRCKMLPAQDQDACRRRIENPADVEGSVKAGGILRKDVTIIPAPAQ